MTPSFRPTQTIAALADRRSPNLMLLGLALVALLIAATMAVLLINERAQAIHEVQMQLKRRVTVLTDSAERAFEAVELEQHALIDQLQRAGMRTPEDFRRLMTGIEANEELIDRAANLPQLSAITLLDTKGAVIDSR